MIPELDIIRDIAERHYTFKRAKLPSTIRQIGTQNHLVEKQQLSQEGTTTWLDVAKRYCKQVLRLYPYQQYRQAYNQEVCLIETELQFKNSQQPGIKWTLLKSNDEINKFTKKWDKIKSFKLHHKNKQSQSATKTKHQGLFNLLTDISASNQKNHQIFTQFLQQMLPPDKKNVKVLGQYQVRTVQVEGCTNCMKNTLCTPCLPPVNYFITITTQNILLSEQSLIDGQIEEAIPYTYALQINYEVKEIINYRRNFIVSIRSGKTFVIISFQNLFDLLKFSYNFNQVKLITPYFERIRFSSFSPVRQNNWTKFYADGQQYFSDLHDEIQKAQTKICITGWCITPYLLLKRPQNIQTGEARLDKTLQRAAKRGVKIFILVFQEPSLFLSNDSFNVWNYFENLHQNFKVLRHPGLIIPQLWSHHEKSVIIDEKVGFMGGLDICYGRWDIHEHPIFDKDGLWEGADYDNERQKAISDPRKYWQSNIDRTNQPRMPWNDIGLQVKGSIVIDLQRHFVQYWYFAINDLSDDPNDYIRNFRNRYHELMRQEKHIKTIQNNRSIRSKSQPNRQELFLNRKPNQAEMKIIQMTFARIKTTQPEEHDYSLRDRIVNAKKAFKDVIKHKAAEKKKEVFVQGFSIHSKPGDMRLQLCRSSSKWSTGINTVEHSIYNAYMVLISNAKEFIYIENQFFMSHQNQISQKIAERIRDAFRNKQQFKVIVMLPLLPGFQGDVRSQKSGVLRVQMQIQYEAINRHKSSIYQLLNDIPIDVNDYIYFVGLRNHALFGKDKNIPKTQIIYVHSKLMIVDDRFMIIGSANINDRSLLGSRDSELAMVIQDPNGKVGFGSIFDFRCRIFKQHFLMNPPQCADINSYWEKFKQIAANNTDIYRRVFGCYPDNRAAKFDDVSRIEKQANPQLYWKQINNLYGHYVEWPIWFLKDQNLNLTFGQFEFLVPIISFT